MICRLIRWWDQVPDNVAGPLVAVTMFALAFGFWYLIYGGLP